MIEIPGAAIVWSETFYPAIVNLFRFEFIQYRPFGLSMNITFIFIFVWSVGTVFLTTRYANEYIGKYPGLMRWWVTLPRDTHAESLLSEIIGTEKNFRVFRSAAFSTAAATAFRPYIILPEIEFTDDELRVILLHEWKHIRDKDYLTEILINLICFVFWWNPVVYILKKNFKFAKELKCDGFAVPSKKDFHHLLDGLVKMNHAEKEKTQILNGSSTLVSKEDELVDRLTVMAMRWESRNKRKILTSACYSVVIVALFFASYAFTVLPFFREIPNLSITTDDITQSDKDAENLFNMIESEIFLVDNNDGSFSYYVDGNFVMNVDADNDILNWVEIRARESD